MKREQDFYNNESLMPEVRDPQYLTSELLKRCENLSEHDRQIVTAALRLAQIFHAGQSRDEGDPYIVHPLRVAIEIIDRLNIKDAKSIAIALLRDKYRSSTPTFTISPLLFLVIFRVEEFY